MENKKTKKPRNLKKEEVKEVIRGFTKILENIQINSKPLVVHSTLQSITTNPQISLEEIQSTFGVKDETKLDFIRQLYIRSATKLLDQLFPDDNILNLPTISFEENGQAILLRY